MDSLPAELVGSICHHMERPSIRSFRLVSKTFAEIGKVHLFQDFEFRLFPNFDSLYSFEQLVARPTISTHLRCISLQTGIQLEYADYRYWHAQQYHDKKSGWERELGSRGADKDEYKCFHEELQARFTTDLPQKYDLYRWHVDQQAAAFAEPHARNYLMRILTSLKQTNPTLQFKMIMVEPETHLEHLEGFDYAQYASDKPYDPDPRRRIANRRQHCLEHFINFLDAAQLASFEMPDLVAVDVPHQLLAIDVPHGAQVLQQVFPRLRSLDLKLSAFPHSDWLHRTGGPVYTNGRSLGARRLRMLLNHSVQLERLSLEFPLGQDSECSYEVFDSLNLDRYPRLWLPNLQSLILCHFRCTWRDLQRLLDDGVRISSLVLKNCRLETGSIVDLLQYLHGRRFQSAELRGYVYVDEDCGNFHFHTEDNFTDCVASTSYEGPYVHQGTRSAVHAYINGLGECPLPRWTSDYDPPQMWEQKGDTSWHFIEGQPR